MELPFDIKNIMKLIAAFYSEAIKFFVFQKKKMMTNLELPFD